MEQKIIQSFESCYYNEVFEITGWKDGDIHSVKTIGFINSKDKDEYPPYKYLLCSISTRLTRQEECILKPYLSKDL